MRLVPFLAAGILALSASVASATPLLQASGLEASSVVQIHHKPGHKGGPPNWARNRDDRPVYQAPTRTTCRTTTQTRYDPYRGTVQQQVQVCDRY